MLKYRTVPFVIGAVLLISVAMGSEDSPSERSKRQAPNINVHQIPKTSFTCADKKMGEYYADPEANCQVYHICIPGMHNKMSLMSFVCPNGTIFSQATRVCTPYDRVDCSLAIRFYESLHGNPSSRRTDYEADGDYENHVPPPPPRPQPAAPRPQATSGRSRNPPPPPQEVQTPPPPRSTTNRFRSGQFRGQQAPPVTTQAPRPSTQAPVRPAFRPPSVPARPAQAATPAAPPRPTVRAVVSTSTANYNYEYEYEYDYEEDGATANDQAGGARSKRDAPVEGADDYYDTRGLNLERVPQKTSFTCQDKVAGGVYADMETDCEMFHICVPLGKYKMLDYKVYCANGSALDQETGSCRGKEEFICENAQSFYQLDKPNQPALGKKPVYKKMKPNKSKKVTLSN